MFAPGPPQNPYSQPPTPNQPSTPGLPPYTLPQNPYGPPPQNPYGQQQSPYGPPQQRQGGGCGRCLGCGCLTLLLFLVIVGVGGFIAYRNGDLNVATLQKMIGQEQPHVRVNNLRDDPVFVRITQLDQDSSSNATYGGEVGSLDHKSYALLTSGRYRVDFGSRTGRQDLGRCTLELESGATYEFVSLPDQIIAYDPDDPPSKGRDLVVETSSLCE